MLHFVDACEAERGCRAAALLEVIISSSLDSDGDGVFISTSVILHTVIVEVSYALGQC